MTDYGFGTCRECEQPAVVQLNGAPLCLGHYDGALRAMRQQFDELGITVPDA